MAIIKCKMCGGDLNLIEGNSTAECEFCGSVQTVPKADDEKRLTLFARANRLRAACDFDKAAGIYEAIIADFPEEAEAYWGLVLCKYGIEYVDDPGSGKKIPTCHRSSFDNILEDSDLEQAFENADMAALKVYRAEAKEFERIRKGIVEVSSTEKPYDVFICYKETDEKGNRTLDSVLAQDLYSALTDKGYRVFFSRITLQGKLGEAYEPYIFAALNSAKVMLAVGSRYEYYNAVWVKNEWSRYLKICQADNSKHLIPCYKDLDPEDMPKEFNHLQGADLGKMGAIQDILFNMEKYIPLQKHTETVVVQQAATGSNPTVESYLKRIFMFLEDGDWKSADEYCEKVLDIDPNNARAYLGKLMAELRVRKQESLKDCASPFDNSNHFQKAVRFGDKQLKDTLNGYITHINTRNENAWLEGIYKQASELTRRDRSEIGYKKAAELFGSIRDYKDSAALEQECLVNAENARKDAILADGKSFMAGSDISSYETAIRQFQSIPGWKDADELVSACQKKIEELKAKAEARRLELARQEEYARKRKKTIALIAVSIVCAAIAFVILLNTVIIPQNRYNDALALMNEGKYAKAISAFEALDGYKDSADKINECNTAIADKKYNDALALMNEGKYAEAISAFEALDGYKDSADKINECNTAIVDKKYNDALALMNEGKYAEAISAFEALEGYKDSADKINECNTAIVDKKYNDALALLAAGDQHGAVIAFYKLGDYKDAKAKCAELWNELTVRETISAGYYHTVGLKADGTVVAVGYNDDGQCDVSNWTDIVAISGNFHTVGLKADGTVVAIGDNKHGRYDVSGWTDIVAISAGMYHTVGLKADGTVSAVGWNNHGQCDVSGWTDIVAISAAEYHTVGLKSDGTVVAVGNNDYRQCNVSGWTDIVAISAGDYHTVGLKADGTVVAVGYNDDGQCDVSNWTDIVAISAGSLHTVGLKADGTVVAVGWNYGGQCRVSGWKDIVAISAGGRHTVGLKADGTVSAVGENDDGQCKVSSWKNIMIPKKPGR